MFRVCCVWCLEKKIERYKTLNTKHQIPNAINLLFRVFVLSCFRDKGLLQSFDSVQVIDMKIEVSNGELVDKVTILSIKLEKFKSDKKRANVIKEYDLLYPVMCKIGLTVDSKAFRQLKEVNLRLWEIEDRIREKEARQAFDQAFIDLARSVYIENDKRSEIKRMINQRTQSSLVEEKEYVDYQ